MKKYIDFPYNREPALRLSKENMTQQLQNPDQQPEQKSSDKDLNFEKMRKSLEAERMARQQAEARMADLERQFKESSKPSVKDDEDDDEPYVDHKKLNRKLASFEKTMEDKIERKAEEKARTLLDQERNSSYLRENPDFQQVMSSDTVQKFADSHPRLAENILRMPDGFERQKLVYENIKALGLDKPKPKEASIQDKINANLRSPFMPSPGQQGPGYNSHGDYSPAGKKSSYDKMKELQSRLRI